MRPVPGGWILAAALALAACGAEPEAPPAAAPPAEPPAAPEAAAPPASPSPAERFPGVPPEAAEVLARVREAAARRDLEALRGLLAAGFSWSFGGDPGAAPAIAHFRDDPGALDELARTLDRGCRHEPGPPARVTCPPEYGSDPEYLGYRAGFERTGGGWRMTFFVAGD